ncbi:MAG: ParB/RepB/Spo0J family partition protein [Desulfarculus sp.]|nr:ParB/RepB/Spo0J family partition protein [Desulfarculus sp.]
MPGLADKLASKGTGLDAGPGGAPMPLDGPGAGRFLEIDPARIEANPHQPRREFDPQALEALAASISEHGLLEPLLVRLEGGRVILVAGERRLRAARMAGLSRVPCTVTAGDPAILALIENLHRQDLTPLEEAEAYHRLQQERGFSLADLAQLAGKAVSTVSEILSLAKLPAPVKQAAGTAPGRFPQRLLVELAKMAPGRAEELAQEAASGGLSAEKVRAQRPKRQPSQAGPEFRRAEISETSQADPKPRRSEEGGSEVSRVDALFRRAEMLAGELLGVNLHGLNYRQRVLAGHSLRPLARACQRFLDFLQETILEDSQRWTPELRAKLLDLVRQQGITQARAVLGRELHEDGQPLHPSELAAQLALARQEASTSAGTEGQPGDAGE